MIEIKTITTGDVRNVGKAINKAQKTILRVMEMLRTDIMRNRLSKARTGPMRRVAHGWKTRTKDTIAGKMRVVTGRNYKKIRESGLPQYPQVLSPDTGHLRQSIFAVYEERGPDSIGRVGTNVFYGAIHELRWNSGALTKAGRPIDRAWLRPALADNMQKILEKFGVDLRAGIAEFSVGVAHD